MRWLFHSTAMVADYDLAVRNLGTLVGLTVLEYSESTEPGIGRRGGMAWVGDNAIEIGQPIVEGGAAQFVERFGGGMHSIALQVEDLEATMAHLEQQEIHIAARPRPEMCFTRPPRHRAASSCSGAPSSSPVDPRFGGTPARAARRRCWRRPRTTPSSAHWSTTPGPGPSRFADCSAPPSRSRTPTRRPANPWRACRSATAPSPSSAARRSGGPALWGRPYERACTHLARHCASTTSTRRPPRPPAPASRRCGPKRDLVVLDPAATGGVQVALTGSLLPGDPRL